jgi:hypothetical protein
MARPKKIQEETPLTEQVSAPETKPVEQPAAPVYTPPAYVPPAPRQMRVERQGSQSEAFVHHYPEIRGGVCEWCGILDRNVPSQYQYKLCPHYRGMDARCSYCPETKNPEEVVYKSAMIVLDHPDKPGTLIMHCNSYECANAHIKRFKRNA